MKTDALSDLVRTVGDDSPPEHKAIFHMWTLLDDLAEDGDMAGQLARGALKRAADALSRNEAT